MTLHRAWSVARGRWRLLTIHQKFEHAVISLLTFLIAVVIVSAVWTLTLKVLSDALQIFALGSAILALGAVHWLVREHDRREHGAGATRQEG